MKPFDFTVHIGTSLDDVYLVHDIKEARHQLSAGFLHKSDYKEFSVEHWNIHGAVKNLNQVLEPYSIKVTVKC